MLGRAWYVEVSHGGGWRSTWARRSKVVLLASTVLAVAVWSLRFAGVLGMRPF
jgi:hypothetical protein